MALVLRVVYQQVLAIGEGVERHADPGRSGVEQTLGCPDFDLRSFRGHGADEDSVGKILEEKFFPISTPCGIGSAIGRYSPLAIRLKLSL